MNDLTKSETQVMQRQESKWTEEQEKLIKDTVCRGASIDELKLFMYVCKKTGLDPFVRQIHSVSRWDSKAGREIRTIQTSIDGFRVIADRSGKYEGQQGPFWCGEDGKWREVWLDDDPPRAAKVGILRTGFKEPVWSIALWSNYCPSFFNKQTGKKEVSKFWREMGPLMLGKVAEALGLRRAFPQDLSSVYSDDEMAYADAEIENEGIRQPQAPVIDYKKETEEKNVAIDELKSICAKATQGLKSKDKGEWMVRVLKVRSFEEIESMKKEEIQNKVADVIRTMNLQ